MKKLVFSPSVGSSILDVEFYFDLSDTGKDKMYSEIQTNHYFKGRSVSA